MDRGLDQMTDTSSLCLQDLVGSGNNNTSNGSIPTSQSNSNDHLHNHHHHHNLHDGTSVSVSSAISNLMSPTSVGSIGSGLTTGLSHLHHSTHPDLSGHHHHHHITSPHTPSVLHEPLEKLKCEWNSKFSRNQSQNGTKRNWTRFVSIIKSLIHKSDQICSKQTNRFATLNIQFDSDEPSMLCIRNSSSAYERDVEMIFLEKKVAKRTWEGWSISLNDVLRFFNALFNDYTTEECLGNFTFLVFLEAKEASEMNWRQVMHKVCWWVL